ncbi:hypothetical protein GE21DRAFT_8682 [Neurospora crassa]|uniref:CHY-type domain-containing protein n=1 Tax=Neurospora crassa (strain ATCC 24698 / 74-OR23-1A / CBS 708.71 / DSM 1257 / FGSC 987) TaxID=367110 RepID=Q7S647_NEUCR|nr:hypothetical protein NCU04713 [Neurospora crassa OR74A]EAA31008.1 hypothetical protein NCU04713 [Neurospora crassa OR74A]KHE83287.1 hypothetical protein GE21DRAFT_8682 [Neurospora crassa]|eukprot:XP_960244.1 hypothetical protein NCU04713 [Neurospora crassa OR74A]
MIPIRPKPNGNNPDGGGSSTTTTSPPPRRDKQAVHTPSPSRITSKPVPERQLRSPREYQIDQLKRRFSPLKETIDPSTGGETSLLFSLKPSDPDFPYDLEKLECDLRIPGEYPRQPARLLVRNKDIPRGFAVNIERGWDRLVEERKGKGTTTLLSVLNALDRGLEGFLAEEKKETVKITVFKDSRHLEGQPSGVIGKEGIEGVSKEKNENEKEKEKEKEKPRPYIPPENFTRDQIAEAKARRAQEVRQLEARMSGLPLYHKSSDGVIYTLPLDPKRRSSLPTGLQSVHSVQLVIPLLYPLQPLRVLLNDVDADEAETVEELFTQKAVEQKQMSLTSHLNYLATNLHALAKQAAQQKQKAVQAAAAAEEEGKKMAADEEAKEAEHVASAVDGERGHVHVIPRPLEWTLVNADGSSESESETDSDDDYELVDGESGNASGVTPGTALPTATAERGTAISFPSIELHGIELLQVTLLSLSVKCNRCKTLNDVTSLKSNVEKLASCKKCATSFTVRFRAELVHANSTRAGFIDLSGCTISDMLPSSFIPTCGRCSTPYPSPGFVSVRGESTTNVCRECHARFTFKLPDVKFLTYSSSQSHLPPTQGPKRKDQKLGLHAGDPLPAKGACAHYKRSYRWFRFSCCNKVYPCDKCHQQAEDHVDEWANRMICGWCSREQNYRVENCAFCGRSVVRKRTGGFWEGGKGTRDKVLMRRGDRRKYRNKKDGNKSNKEK